MTQPEGLSPQVQPHELRRETATHQQDLPHEFASEQDESECELCGKGSEDVRHLAWTASQQGVDREHAQDNSMIVREFGS